jgi:hypothetical protein
MWLRSTPGQGATFGFSLPHAQGEAPDNEDNTRSENT